MDRMQHQRFEQKYLVNEACALRIRDFVGTHLDLDPNSEGRPNNSYAVHSIYLDSDNLTTYWMTVNGSKNRFKLRLRYYDNRPTSPVYLEIKRRVDRVIMKQRAVVRKAAVARILAGEPVEMDWLLAQDAKHVMALDHFLELVARLEARPRVHVGYIREAWIDPENDAVRLTLDRHVCAEPQSRLCFSTRFTAPVVPFGKTVILELKFTDRFPKWYREMIERFDLMQCGAAKYCEGVAMIGEERLGHRLSRFADAGLDPTTLLRVEGLDGPTPRLHEAPA